MTGFREAEVQHVTWKDVDLKEQVVRVTAKPEYGFFPKDWEEREVPIPDRLAQALKARSKSKWPLVFPTPDGKRNGHFLPAAEVDRLSCQPELRKLRQWRSAVCSGTALRPLVSAQVPGDVCHHAPPRGRGLGYSSALDGA